jgi:uncharacterized protein YjiK
MRLPYDLQRPAWTIELPWRFREISGIAPLTGDGAIGFVEDERVCVHEIDRDTGRITQHHDHGKGDAEDLVVMDGAAYILCAGRRPHLIHMETCRHSHGRLTRIDLELDSACDPEGLCPDPGGNRLLIACKGTPPGTGKERMRQILAFDLETQRRSSQPVLSIDTVQVAGEPGLFNPSALAVHPISGDLYVIGSKGSKRLACWRADGTFRGSWRLDRQLLPQPEGIAFSTSGELILSSEGRSRKKKKRKKSRGKGKGKLRHAPRICGFPLMNAAGGTIS